MIQVVEKGFAERQKDVVSLVLDVVLRSEFSSYRRDGLLNSWRIITPTATNVTFCY